MAFSELPGTGRVPLLLPRSTGLFLPGFGRAPKPRRGRGKRLATAVAALPSFARSFGKVLIKAVAGLVAFLIVGNLAIFAASLWAKGATADRSIDVPGVENVAAVDPRVWRGAAPSVEGYRALADRGVTTVVDLRAEEGVEADVATVTDLGMQSFRIPIRDGQNPSNDDVKLFLQTVRDADGLVFVHCGAGVGRTGAMVGAYVVARGDQSGRSALRENLAMGPPSLEQVAFVANMAQGRLDQPGLPLRMMSRTLDAPRRIFHNLGL